MTTTAATKLSKTQRALLEALRDGYQVTPARYMGTFGTIPARCRREPGENVRITQATIDALHSRKLVAYAGPQWGDKHIVLTDAGRAAL